MEQLFLLESMDDMIYILLNLVNIKAVNPEDILDGLCYQLRLFHRLNLQDQRIFLSSNIFYSLFICHLLRGV